MAIAGKIEQLLLAAFQRSKRWLLCNQFHRRESGQRVPRAIDILPVCRAQVRFVEPASSLLRQDARQALAVQIGPAVVRAIKSVRKVLQALGIDIPNCFVNGCGRIVELQKWQRFQKITASAVDGGAGLRCRHKVGIKRLARVIRRL
jgi:hypothetical protein